MLNSYSLDSPGSSFVNKPPQHSSSFSKNSALTSPASLSDELAIVAKMLSTLANSFEVEQYDANTSRTTPRQAALGDHLPAGRRSPQSRGESPNNNISLQVGSLFGGGPSIPLISLKKRIAGIHSKVSALQQACEHFASTAAAPSLASNGRVGGGGVILESSLMMSQSASGGLFSRNANSTQHLLHNNNNGDMVPQPPRLPPPQASLASNTFQRGAAGNGAAMAPTSVAHPGCTLPSPSSPRLKLSKPSSERVRQLPRATVPDGLLKDTSLLKRADKLRQQGGGGSIGASLDGAAVNGIFNPNFKELQKVMTSTLYNVVESVVRTCQADRGYITTRQVSKSTMSVADAAAIFSRNSAGEQSSAKIASGGGDAEMVSIVNVEAALRFPPSLHRHQVEGSLAAGVLATGIALHQRAVPYPPGDPAELKYKNSPSSHIPITSNVLMFPIRRPPAVGDTWGSSRGDIIAVLVIENKHGGSTPFTPVDENLCNMTTQILGEIMTRMPESVLDWSAHYFDPIGLHVVQPFVPFSKSLLRSRTTTGGTNAANDGTFLTSIGAQSGDAALGAMCRMAPHVPEQVIRRATVQPSSSKVRRNVNEGGKTSSSTTATSTPVPKASGGDVSTYFSQLKEQRALLAKVGEGNTLNMSSLITSKHSNHGTSSIEVPSKADQHELEFSSSNAGGVIAGLGPAPTLREMDSFLTNLTDCWQRSVQSCVEQQSSKKQQEREAKLVREQLLQAKKYIQKLEAEMRLHRLNADDYREEYRGLHEELEAFLKTKTSGSDDP